jgi:hypothetical protein
MDKRRTQAVEMAVETFDALVAERGDTGKIWASVLKEAIKRRKPDFSESYYGFRTFGNLLEEMKARGLLEFGRDEKSGAYVYRGSSAAVQASVADVSEGDAQAAPEQQQEDGAQDKREGRRGRGNRGGRNRRGGAPDPQEHTEAQPVEGIEADEVAVALESAAADYAAEVSSAVHALAELAPEEEALGAAEEPAPAEPEAAPAKRTRGARKPAAKKPRAAKAKATEGGTEPGDAVDAVLADVPVAEAAIEAVTDAPAIDNAEAEAGDAEGVAAAKRARKPGTHKAPARSRLPRKPKGKTEA